MYGGYRQQDAQELMMNLRNGVIEEEKERLQNAVRQTFGITKRSQMEKVSVFVYV